MLPSLDSPHFIQFVDNGGLEHKEDDSDCVLVSGCASYRAGFNFGRDVKVAVHLSSMHRSISRA
jgi:hypothetical protein